MVCEVQAATDENLYLTFLVSQSGTLETQAPGFHLVQELHYFMFMKLRPLVFILCNHFTISFSWNSGPKFASCARMSPFDFHESQSHAFSLCMHFTAYFSSISGPCFQPLWATSTYIFSYSLTPRILSLSTVSCFKFVKFMRGNRQPYLKKIVSVCAWG